MSGRAAQVRPSAALPAVVGSAENRAGGEPSGVASGGMTLGRLITGLALLLILLIAAGQLGSLGPVELLIWLALVAAWITLWAARRARARATP